ncbi:MAG TPA: tetratricopeptide repeat protein, partial [Clostridia bacterium]
YALYSRLRFKAFKELFEGNYECASVSALEAFNIYDKDAVLHRISGMSNYMTREYEKAIDAFNRALAITPSNADFLSYRGNVYFKKGDFKNAQKDYEEALKLVPESFYLKKKILKCMYEQKEYKIAEKFLRSITLKGYQDLELDIMANTLIKPSLIDKLAKVKKASGLVKKIKNAIFSNGITIILFFTVAISFVAALLTLLIFFMASYCPYLIPVVFVAAALLFAFKVYKDSYGGN